MSLQNFFKACLIGLPFPFSYMDFALEPALYKESHPGASPSDVRSAILNSAPLPTTVCNGSSHGYFSGEKDGFNEPLLPFPFCIIQ